MWLKYRPSPPARLLFNISSTFPDGPCPPSPCPRLGVYPRELWKEPLRIPPRGDLDAVKLQYVHQAQGGPGLPDPLCGGWGVGGGRPCLLPGNPGQERRRKQKLAALRAERLALTLQDCDVTKKVSGGGEVWGGGGRGEC